MYIGYRNHKNKFKRRHACSIRIMSLVSILAYNYFNTLMIIIWLKYYYFVFSYLTTLSLHSIKPSIDD